MTKTIRKVTAIVALIGMSQTACFNTYFISQNELEKLESSVEPQEVVEVYADCPAGTVAMNATNPMWAQATPAEPAEPTDPAGVGETATDAPAADTRAPTESSTASILANDDADSTATASTNTAGCTKVDVKAGNALYIIDDQDGRSRVTPFNFIMNGGQLVSPEYDVLMPLDQVKGAEVREFSTWKTVGTIVGVSAVAIGTFVAIAVLAPDASGFSQ